jgi:hypothetical protein
MSEFLVKFLLHFILMRCNRVVEGFVRGDFILELLSEAFEPWEVTKTEDLTPTLL